MSWKSCWGCLALPAFLFQSHQTGGFSTWSSFHIIYCLITQDKKIASSEAAYSSSLQISICCCSWSTVKIFSTNLVTWCMSNSVAKPVGMIHNHSHFISKTMNGSMLILINELLDFSNSTRHCGVDGPPCVLVIVNKYPTGLELSILYKHPERKINAFFQKHLAIIANVSMALFLIFRKTCYSLAVPFSDLLWNCHTPRTQLPQ